MCCSVLQCVVVQQRTTQGTQHTLHTHCNRLRHITQDAEREALKMLQQADQDHNGQVYVSRITHMCVVVCCSVLQCEVCCSVLQYVLQTNLCQSCHTHVCCSVLQCVAVCCVLQCVAMCGTRHQFKVCDMTPAFICVT